VESGGGSVEFTLLELILQHHLSVLNDAVDLKHVHYQIDAQCFNLHVGRSCLFKWVGKHLHFGTLPCRLGRGVYLIGRHQQTKVNSTPLPTQVNFVAMHFSQR
jgi:hypothetical protein